MAAATAVVSRRGTDHFRGLFSDTFSVVATLNASSLADGAGETNTIAVPGVKLGDIVLNISMGVDVSGISVTPYVSAADVVSIRFQNESGGTLDLASTTVRCVVVRMVYVLGRLKTAQFKGKYGYFPVFAKQELCDLHAALRHQDNDGAPRVSAGRRKASRGSTRACQTSNGQTPQKSEPGNRITKEKIMMYGNSKAPKMSKAPKDKKGVPVTIMVAVGKPKLPVKGQRAATNMMKSGRGK